MNPIGGQKHPLYIEGIYYEEGEYYIVGNTRYHKDWYEPVSTVPIEPQEAFRAPLRRAK